MKTAKMPNIKPILKWAGGKRQLLKYISLYYPQKFNNYYEPFIGGASVFFDLKPSGNVFINDYNEEIINVYKNIQYAPNELINLLENHAQLHNKEHFYNTRNLDRNPNQFDKLAPVERAARTIYLNRTCYNGLYRVNRKGFFNTPMGRYSNPLICDVQNILNINNYFNNTNITFTCGDFEKALYGVNKNDFVYLDPPYYPISLTSSFTDYTKVGFTKQDQIRLYECCKNINDKEAFFMQSNSDCDFIRDLYKDFKITKVPVKRFINSNGSGRKQLYELIITNYN